MALPSSVANHVLDGMEIDADAALAAVDREVCGQRGEEMILIDYLDELRVGQAAPTLQLLDRIAGDFDRNGLPIEQGQFENHEIAIDTWAADEAIESAEALGELLQLRGIRGSDGVGLSRPVICFTEANPRKRPVFELTREIVADELLDAAMSGGVRPGRFKRRDLSPLFVDPIVHWKLPDPCFVGNMGSRRASFNNTRLGLNI